MFGMDMFGPRGSHFSQTYRCYSSSFGALSDAKSEDIRKGGKIIMPPSALEQLTRLNISYPMLFKLTNKNNNDRSTHCGVLEFVAEEGVIFLPYWMMQNLLLNEGEQVYLQNCSLPVATYAKFQAQSTEFLDISNPKAVLENALRNFACLTKGDVIAIQYNATQYELLVQDIKPDNAVCIIECDLRLEFEAPVDYQPPVRPVNKKEPEVVVGSLDLSKEVGEYMKENAGFAAFHGRGNRLDGKKKHLKSKKNQKDQQSAEVDMNSFERGLPNKKWTFGHLNYIRNNEPKTNSNSDSDNKFEAFTGKGEKLRRKKQR